MQASIFGTRAVVVLVVFSGAAAVYALWPRTPTTAPVVQEPIVETIALSGVVQPQERVTLAFEQAGRITDMRTVRGDHVVRGYTLAYLDSSIARAELAQQQAQLQTEQAQLDILVRGATVQEINVERAKVAQATESLATAETALQTALINAFTVASNAVYTVADDMFDNPRSNIPTLRYIISDASLKTRIENERLALQDILTTWNTDIAPLVTLNAPDTTHTTLRRWFVAGAALALDPRTHTTIDTAAVTDTTRTHLLTVRGFLEDLAQYLTLLSTSASLASPSDIQTWRTNVSTTRTNVQGALTTLDTAYTTYTAAQESLRVAQAHEQLIVTGATNEDIRVQDAKVAAARAQVQIKEAALLRYSIRVPADGTINDKLKNVGELVSAGEPVFIEDTGTIYDIEGRVSELDIVRLHKGMNATVTFDALGDQQFGAIITHVDDAERTIGNDEGYGVTLRLVADTAPLKAGMTANIVVPLYHDE